LSNPCDSNSIRISQFTKIQFAAISKDCGFDQSNINCSELDFGELRYSYGVGVTWITQLGPMSLAVAAPSNEGPLDETENFQFEIGTQF
jgi:outer membrane protein insertion porin family